MTILPGRYSLDRIYIIIAIANAVVTDDIPICMPIQKETKVTL